MDFNVNVDVNQNQYNNFQDANDIMISTVTGQSSTMNDVPIKMNMNSMSNMNNIDIASSVAMPNANTNTQIGLENIGLSIVDSQIDLEEQEALRQTELYNQRKMERIREKMEKELQAKKETIQKANEWTEQWIL